MQSSEVVLRGACTMFAFWQPVPVPMPVPVGCYAHTGFRSLSVRIKPDRKVHKLLRSLTDWQRERERVESMQNLALDIAHTPYDTSIIYA